MSVPQLEKPNLGGEFSSVRLILAADAFTDSIEYGREHGHGFGSEWESTNPTEGETRHGEEDRITQDVDKEDKSEEHDSIEYPSTWKLLIIVLALDLALFCMALDNTILGTALPKITDEFKSLDDVGWYASAYLLTRCAFQLPFGKVYTYFSIKWTFVAAVVIFEIGSAISASAPNSPVLIFGRAVAGLGSSGIFAGIYIIIAYTVPLRKRPIYTGFFGGIYGIASVAGPLLGGVLADSYLTWRWCFYINLPIGAITLIVIIIFLRLPSSKTTQKFYWKQAWYKMDLPGACVLLPCMVCLLLFLDWGGSTYAWTDGRIIALIVLFAVLALVFSVTQYWNGDNATVPGFILKQRTVAGCGIFSFCLGGSFYVLIYWIPIWFQAIKGIDAIESGIHILPMLIAVTIFSIGSGVAISTFGYYNPWIILSSVAASIGAGLITTFQVTTGTSAWIGYQVIFGIGMGCGMPQTTMAAIQNVLPLEAIPIGTAFITFTQNIGGAIFSSVAQSIFTNELSSEVRKIEPHVNPSLIVNSGATLLRKVVAPKFLHNVLIAYNEALTQTWYISVALSCVSIVGALMLEWKSMKRKQSESQA